MALIKDAKGRKKEQGSSGYQRLFGDQELGQLMSKVHATVITAGTELEKIIWEQSRQIVDLEEFIRNSSAIIEKSDSDVRPWVATKAHIVKLFKKQNHVGNLSNKSQPDFLVFDIKKQICYVVELKDGDTFDTKKADGERTALHKFKNDKTIQSLLSPFLIKISFCSFNSDEKQKIIVGAKGRFLEDEVMTGQELCNMLHISYADIIKQREIQQPENFHFFLNELLKIDKIRAIIRKILNSFKR